MGYNCKVKEYTKKKKNFQKLAAKLEYYSHILKVGFSKGENGAKKISTPSAEKYLREALGNISYENLYKIEENIQNLMYGNTPEWKRKITEYVNSWLFIQNQILYNLRLINDNLTKIASAAIIGQGMLQIIERNALQREVDIYADRIIEIATNTSKGWNSFFET